MTETRKQGKEPLWLTHARRLQAIAQTGLTFSQDPFDIERYEQVRQIAASMMADGSGAPQEAILGQFRQESGYATPKVDVRGAVFREDRILLVQERRDRLWTPPGGWADVNDRPAEAVEREIEEESGFTAKAVKLAAVYDKRLHGHPPSPRHTWKLFFICELTGGKARQSHETIGIDFFGEGDLPDLSLSRITREEITMLFRHYFDMGLPTEFD